MCWPLKLLSLPEQRRTPNRWDFSSSFPVPQGALLFSLIQFQVLRWPQLSSKVQNKLALAFPSKSQCNLIWPTSGFSLPDFSYTKNSEGMEARGPTGWALRLHLLSVASSVHFEVICSWGSSFVNHLRSLLARQLMWSWRCGHDSQENRWVGLGKTLPLGQIGKERADMISCAFNYRTQKLERGGSLWAAGQPCLFSKFQASQYYLKKKKTLSRKKKHRKKNPKTVTKIITLSRASEDLIKYIHKCKCNFMYIFY